MSKRRITSFQPDDDVQELLDLIHQNGFRIGRLINDALKASQAKNASKMRSKARRLVPMTETLAKALKPMAKGAGEPVCGYANTSNEIWKLGQASGVTWKPNGLRHSYASYRLALIHDAARVADELGNSPAMVFRHYRALVTPGQAEKWFAISPK